MTGPTTKTIADLTMRQMMTWATTKRTEEKCRTEMATLSNAIIAAFAADHARAPMHPTTDNVSAIVIEEMMCWRTIGATDASRRADLDALADRIIRYMSIFYAEPVQLDGLPGGHAFEPAALALGRRNVSRRSLMTGSTGIVLPS